MKTRYAALTLLVGASITTLLLKSIRRQSQLALDAHMATISAVAPTEVKNLSADDRRLWIIANQQWDEPTPAWQPDPALEMLTLPSQDQVQDNVTRLLARSSQGKVHIDLARMLSAFKDAATSQKNQTSNPA